MPRNCQFIRNASQAENVLTSELFKTNIASSEKVTIE